MHGRLRQEGAQVFELLFSCCTNLSCLKKLFKLIQCFLYSIFHDFLLIRHGIHAFLIMLVTGVNMFIVSVILSNDVF